MNQRSDYTEAWNDYRRRRLVCWIVWLSYVPGVALTVLPLSWLTGIKSDYFAYPIAGAWMTAMAITTYRLATFPCPRCGKRYSLIIGDPLVRQCVHCDLPRWTILD
jgi:hypothetical protein